LSPLLALNIRPFTGASSDKIGAKIRLAQLEKVSYMLVLGAREKRGGDSCRATPQEQR